MDRGSASQMGPRSVVAAERNSELASVFKPAIEGTRYGPESSGVIGIVVRFIER